MTAQDVFDRLVGSAKGQTPQRLEKAKGLAARSKVEWADVEALIQAQERTMKKPKGGGKKKC